MDIMKIETTMSSREIAKLTDKEHRNVLADCDKLNENYINMGLAEISAGVFIHPSTGSQKHREYLLTKIQSLDLMTGYRLDLRIKINRRWEELEKEKQKSEFNIPKTLPEALRLAADQAEEIQKLEQKVTEQDNKIYLKDTFIEKQQIKLEEQAPKVLFADTVTESQDSILIAELAKILAQKGYPIGQNRLYEWLRQNKYLGSYGEYYNLPTQRYVEMGLFEIKKTSIQKSNGTIFVSTTTKVTGKGQIYFINKFLKKDQ